MNGEEALKFDNQLCFLFYGISRALTRLYTPLLSPLGLTYPQYLVMLILWEEDHREVGQLTRKLMMDTGTVSPLLKRMEAGGLIKRSRQSKDERKVVVTLTEKGKKLKNKALNIPQLLFCKTGIDKEEVPALKKELQKLLKNLTD